jgi:hypothetical protein
MNVLLRLRDFQGGGLACMANLGLPFDNYQGEREVRRVQGKQQVSGGCRMLAGAKRFGRMRGALSTARKHAQNACEALRDALHGTPFLPSSEMR